MYFSEVELDIVHAFQFCLFIYLADGKDWTTDWTTDEKHIINELGRNIYTSNELVGINNREAAEVVLAIALVAEGELFTTQGM